jgi:hypothetical protein
VHGRILPVTPRAEQGIPLSGAPNPLATIESDHALHAQTNQPVSRTTR